MERIVGVALLREDGAIVSLPRPNRHGDIFFAIRKTSMRSRWPHRAKQGFTTSEGRFVDRLEGRRIAEDAGQIRPDANASDTLFSEDVW